MALTEPIRYWEIAHDLVRDAKRIADQRLASEAAQVGRDQNLSREEFSDGMRSLVNAYDTFLGATNPFRQDMSQDQFWYNHYRDVRLGKKSGQPILHHEVISGAAYDYLRGPLRVPMLDRGLVDALIAQETFAFIDRSAGYAAVGTPFGCLGVWLALGLGAQYVWGDRSINWTEFRWTMGVLFVVMLAFWAWPKRGPYRLYMAMKDTYQLLTGSVVSVPELHRRIEEARAKGVVWPPELYAVMDDIETRRRAI